MTWIGPGCLKKLHVRHGFGHFQTRGKRANDRYLMVTRLIQPLPHASFERTLGLMENSGADVSRV